MLSFRMSTLIWAGDPPPSWAMPKGKVVSMGFLPLIHPPRNFVGYHGFLSLTKVLSVTEKCNKQKACGVMHWRRNLDKTAAFLLLKVLKFQVKRVFGPV